MHTSSRNSEVIHAGIYYPPGSLKAELCVAGKKALYAYCQAHEVDHRRCGKIIVAIRDAEIPVLEKLKAQSEANGVDDLVWLDRAEVRAMRPTVSCVRGLHSPSTGIIDSHGFLAALRRDAIEAGAQVVLESPVRGGRLLDDGVELVVGGADAMTVQCHGVVNAAGLRRRFWREPSSGSHPRASRVATLPKGTTSSSRASLRFRGWSTRSPHRGGSACTSRSISQGRRASGPMCRGSTVFATSWTSRTPLRSTQRSARIIPI